MNKLEESIAGIQISLVGIVLTILLMDSELFWIGLIPVIIGTYIVFSRLIS